MGHFDDEVAAKDDAGATPEALDDADEALEEDEELEDEAEADDDDAEGREREETDESGDESLPIGIQRRFSKLTRKRREAEARVRELESEVERLKGIAEDPKMMLAVAEKHGVLPELLDKRTSRGLEDLDQEKRYQEGVSDLLDELEDSGEQEIEFNGNRYTRKQLRKMLRDSKERMESLNEQFGDASRQLCKRMAKIFKLGLAAEREANEKPAKRAEKRKAPVRRDDDDRDDELLPREQPRKRMIGVERSKRERETPRDRLRGIVRSFLQ